MRRDDGRRHLWVVLAVAGLLTAGLILPVYWVYLLQAVAVGALVARGIGLVTNQAGLLTLCQMSFAAIGGWVVAWLALAWPSTPFPLLVLIGGAAAAPVGLMLGAAAARIRGVELAVVTLGFAVALDLVLRQGSFPGVGAGVPTIPSPPFDDPRWSLILAWTVLGLLQIGAVALGRTRHGRGWAAVRVSERAAAALGVRVGTAKASAFAVGALFAGVAGGLLAGQYGLLTTSVFSPLTSMAHLVTAVLCGASLFGGAVLAGAFAVVIPELLRRAGLPLDVSAALLALGAVDVLRRGNGGLIEQLDARLRDRSFRQVRVDCRLDIAPASAPAAPGVQGARLEITGLTVVLGGQRVLDALDLTVDAGEVHALIGPNGAGKTTLVDVITGFLPGAAGEVRVQGEPIDDASATRRARLGIRRTFQQTRPPTALTVGEYVRLAAGRADRARVTAVSAFFGLPDARVPIRLMDTGSRRVLEIAAALASAPRILLLDEPAAGLDEATSLLLAERVRRIPADFGCAVLLVEHDMGFVRAASMRTTVLDRGRVIAGGPTADALDDPRVIAAYLGREARER